MFKGRRHECTKEEKKKKEQQFRGGRIRQRKKIDHHAERKKKKTENSDKTKEKCLRKRSTFDVSLPVEHRLYCVEHGFYAQVIVFHRRSRTFKI